jgi:sterol 24-C-methyltransferase
MQIIYALLIGVWRFMIICLFIQADFMKMPFADNTFDAIYAIEATCHAPDVVGNLVPHPEMDILNTFNSLYWSEQVGCYKEIYRVLKPGQCFAASEWSVTDHFDPTNISHQKIKAEIELGNGLPDIRTTHQCLEALKQAGFEVIKEKSSSSSLWSTSI